MYRKRERTQNWSLQEKKYLLELVKSRLDVLENKRIDSASSAMKGMAWQDIHASFAARFGNDRDAHRVREQWRRMKGQARTEMLEFAERVRNYGAEVANQRWPSALAEDVWKTLESARNINDYPHGFAAGDDVGSPAILDDDDDDDMDADGANERLGDDDMKMDPDERYERYPNYRDPESAAELMNILRPKVELNDIPELDTSMGLSITAVKMGSGGQKRRMLDQHEPALKNSHWYSPAPASTPTPAVATAQSVRAATPLQQHQVAVNANNCLPHRTAGGAEARRLEHRRRAEMLEVEHEAKMELLRVEKETADARLRIALRDETDADRALTCRSCGAERVGRGAIPATPGVATPRLAAPLNAKSKVKDAADAGDPDLDNDVGRDASATTATQERLSPPSPLDDATLGLGHANDVNDVNGIKEEDDNNNQE